jgi:hypothetical protein
VTPVTPPPPAAPAVSPADTPSATPVAAPALRTSIAVRGGVGTTTGTVPAGATRIVQTARAGGSVATEAFLEMANAKTTTGVCRIIAVKKTTTKKAGPRTYTCRIKLSKGPWTVTTTARGPAGVVAEGTRRVVVR